MARRVSGAAAVGVLDGVAVGEAVEVRDALGDAPGTNVPRIQTSSKRSVLELQRKAVRPQQKSGLPSASLEGM